MQTIKVDLNNKSAVIDLDSYIQVQQGDSALPVQFLFVSGTDTVDMSDGKLGFISGVTDGDHNIELEAPGNGAGQCVINLNSYLFQDAGAFKWLYVGVKDNNDNVITAVNATLTVKASNLDNGINTGDYRSDWQNFKKGLSSEVDSLDSAVNGTASQVTAASQQVIKMESQASQAVSQAQSASDLLSSASSKVDSVCDYAKSATDQSVSQAQSAVNEMNNSVQTAISGMSNNLTHQLANCIKDINISDTNLMNGSSGAIKAQKLGNTVTLNLIIKNYTKSGTVVYQLPQQYQPTSQRVAQSWEINLTNLYLDNLTINTDGTITIAQRDSNNSPVQNINMNGTFTYFI